MLLLALTLAAHADDRDTFLDWATRQAAPETVPLVAEGYRFQATVFQQIAAAIADRPGEVDVELMGHTTTGKPMWAFHVHDYAHPVERRVLVFGGIHALEWIGTEVATDVLLDEIEHPEAGVDVTVVPLLNPDGRAKVERDLVDGKNLYRRGNEKNVDLNRDFAVNRDVRAIWHVLLPAYYAHSESPLSQPESQALDALASRGHYDRAVSLHSFGGFLYYPWAGLWKAPPDEADFVELGHAMEAAQGSHAYKTRELSHWGFFFRAQGAELDHLYGMYGTRSFLIELSRSGIQPFHPWTWHTYFRWYNPEDVAPDLGRGVRAVEELIRHATTPGELTRPAGAAPR